MQVLILEIAVACIVKTETRSTSMAYLGLFSGCVALFNTMNKTAQHWLSYFTGKDFKAGGVTAEEKNNSDSVSPIVLLSAFPANLFFFVLIVLYILVFKMHLHCIKLYLVLFSVKVFYLHVNK